MDKLIGAALLLLATVCMVVRERMQLNRRLRALHAWQSILSFARSQIACYALPLDEILAQLEPTLLRDATMGEPAPPHLAQLCEVAGGMLQGRCGALLSALSQRIGTVFREEQLSQLDDLLREWADATSEDERQLERQRRLITPLSLCAACGVVLLLW